MVLFVGYLYFLKLWNIIQLRFNGYVKLFITQITCFSSNYKQLKEKVLWNYKHGSFWCILLDEVESDLDEDVDNEMNDIGSESGNYEVDCHTGSVANASVILVPDILLKFIVHHLDTLPLTAQPILKKIRHLEVQKHWKTNKKVQCDLTAKILHIFLMIESHLMSLRKPLIRITYFSYCSSSKFVCITKWS